MYFSVYKTPHTFLTQNLVNNILNIKKHDI